MKQTDVGKLLNSISKKTFVKYYETFKDTDISHQEMIDRLALDSQKFTPTSRANKTSTARRIFREGLEIEALLIIVGSRADLDTVEKARKLLDMELENNNLSGRAGRMSKDICGNIICIDFGKWFQDNYSNKKIEDVEFKKNLVLRDDVEKLSEFIKNKKEVVETIKNKKEVDTYKQVEGVLVIEKIEGISSVEAYSDEDNLSSIKEIDCILSEIVDKNIVHKSLLKKLVGIDIIAINNLWRLFQENVCKIQTYILINPFGDGVNKRFNDILMIINSIFFNNSKSIDYLSAIRAVSLSWMKEESLKNILFYKFNPEKYSSDEINDKIQSSIKFLNDDIRFTFSKYIYAYQEVLKTFLEQSGKQIYIEKISNYPLFLEFGACSKISLELMSLGIFREGSIELSKHILGENSQEIINELKHLDFGANKMNDYLKRKLREKIKLIR
ncbi:hypothetical protein [Clostridium estertheticum]|uniref:hypothetical protein n=1 Tax=Clostridium estertheticum TaxID=238834 RepID=UPI001CF2C9DD|nr:hypothetical protein [Clostridium estertheticum]MCB2339953.1 hypothetical protein [Clostridium estertheticum]